MIERTMLVIRPQVMALGAPAGLQGAALGATTALRPTPAPPTAHAPGGHLGVGVAGAGVAGVPSTPGGPHPTSHLGVGVGPPPGSLHHSTIITLPTVTTSTAKVI